MDLITSTQPPTQKANLDTSVKNRNKAAVKHCIKKLLCLISAIYTLSKIVETEVQNCEDRP